MLRVRQLFDAESSTYTYLLCDTASGAAALVDPVFEQFTRDDALVRELGVDLRFVLDTHVHADHVTAAWLFREARGARIVSSARASAEGVDLPVDDGSRLELGATTLEVRATPGHTDGCLTLVAEGALVAFTGDALLIRGAGRTDFQQGSAAQLFRSIRERIFALDDDTTLYPAHDYAGRTSTTVAEEKAHNPRVGGAANERDFVGYMQNLHLPHPKKIDEAVPANLRSGRPLEPPTGAPSWGPVVRTYAGFPEIEAPWVEAHRGDVLVLDVRDADELESDGRVEGALHIPLSELRARVGEVPRDRPVITLCRSGRRSAQATVLLRAAGLGECANLRGGLLAWRG